MVEANIMGARYWFHCMGMCEAKKNCYVGGVRAWIWGAQREIFQLIPHFEWDTDDWRANWHGVTCPESQTCEERCDKYNSNPNAQGDPYLDPSDWPAL